MMVIEKQAKSIIEGGTEYNTYTTPTFIFTPFERLINQIEEVESSIRAAKAIGNIDMLKNKNLELSMLQNELKNRIRRVRRQVLYGG